MLRHQATGILYEHLQSTGQCQASWIECMNGVCGICFFLIRWEKFSPTEHFLVSKMNGHEV